MDKKTSRKIRNDLKTAYSKLDIESNPDLAWVLRMILRYFDSEQDVFRMAYELDTACVTEKLPECIIPVIRELYLQAAKEDGINSTMAYNNLAMMYYNGRAGKRNYREAIRYLTLADEGGERLATENLAYCYYYGLGTAQDYEKAYYYFSKAAVRGRYEAMMRLGDMFRYGQYVDKDENMVYSAYLQAYSLMNTSYETDTVAEGSVLERLGDLYYEGIGVDADPERAYGFYQNAERGLMAQIRSGDQYCKTHLPKVREKLAELKTMLEKELPDLDFD